MSSLSKKKKTTLDLKHRPFFSLRPPSIPKSLVLAPERENYVRRFQSRCNFTLSIISVKVHRQTTRVRFEPSTTGKSLRWDKSPRPLQTVM